MGHLPIMTAENDGFYEIDRKKSLFKAPMFFKINENDETFYEKIKRLKILMMKELEILLKMGNIF